MTKNSEICEQVVTLLREACEQDKRLAMVLAANADEPDEWERHMERWAVKGLAIIDKLDRKERHQS